MAHVFILWDNIIVTVFAVLSVFMTHHSHGSQSNRIHYLIEPGRRPMNRNILISQKEKRKTHKGQDNLPKVTHPGSGL